MNRIGHIPETLRTFSAFSKSDNREQFFRHFSWAIALRRRPSISKFPSSPRAAAVRHIAWGAIALFTAGCGDTAGNVINTEADNTVKQPKDTSVTVSSQAYESYLAAPPRLVRLGCQTIHVPNHWFWRWKKAEGGIATLRYFSPSYPKLDPSPQYTDPPETLYTVVQKSAFILYPERPERRANLRHLIDPLPIQYIQFRQAPVDSSGDCGNTRFGAEPPFVWEPEKTRFSAPLSAVGSGKPSYVGRAYRDTDRNLLIVYSWDASEIPPGQWGNMDRDVGKLVEFLLNGKAE